MRLRSGFQHIIHGILRLETSTRQQRSTVAGALVTLPGAGATVPGSSGIGGSMLGSLTGLVDRAITSTESSEMSTFLSEFRNVLGN